MIYPEKLIKEAINEASEILNSGFGKVWEGKLKESQSSIVTEMDVAAEKKITHIITSRYPGHSIIGEEKGAVMTGSEYTWVIDPIDGTSNYAAGIPWFGTLIALLRFDQPVAAGAYLPFYDLLYYAEKGKGVFRNGQPVSVSAEREIKNMLFAYSTDYSEDIEDMKKEMALWGDLARNVRNLRSTNSLIDFCYIIDGRFGGCINHFTKIWDIAAPYLILSEAGGIMTLIDGNRIRFDLSIENYLKNYAVLAGNKFGYEQALNLARIYFS